MLRNWLVFFLLVGLSLSSQAQITLTHPDVGRAGDSVIYQIATGVTSAGDSGVNQTWNWSSLSGAGTSVSKFYRPNQLPFANPFGNAVNLAAEEQFAYQFYRLDTTSANAQGLYLRGIYVPLDTPVLGLTGFRLALSRELPVMRFPSTYNSTASQTATARFAFPFDTTLSLGGSPVNVDSIRINANIAVNSIINGWGTAILGTSANPVSIPALRQKSYQDIQLTFEVYSVIILFGRPIGTWVSVPSSFIDGLGVPTRFEVTQIRYWGNGKKFPIVDVTMDSTQRGVDLFRFQTPLSLSLSETLASGKSVLWPNPVHGVVRLSTPFEQESTVLVRNALGQIVLKTRTLASEASFDTQTWARGAYWVQVISPQQKAQTLRLVVE